ncbi:U-box domain-containing protein 33 isoform X3 [Argentina anserina]|uniref:U-box domain-containing protein 33 isoform X3 n=1 Tax=Argentina anserina TaxID=57926 RepID=UPI0021765DA9|nr:U-box domain-containing protein 33 isoform X3 [Potentilla anserina]
MAVVRSVPAMMRPAEPIRYPDTSDMASFGEIVVEPVARVIQDMIYVTVGTSVKESKSNLIWTLQNSGGKRVCIIHVHQPAMMIPMMGTKFPASQMKDQEVRAFREIERQNMQKILEDYLRICRQMGVRAEKLHIEMDCIEKGIVELISQHGIRKLVMGAAADKSHSSRKMTDLKSKKAIYVREHAPIFCHIQFVCKGHLIHTREANLDAIDTQVALPPPRPSPDSEPSRLHLRSRSSVTFGQNNRLPLSNPAQDLFRRVRSSKTDKYGGSTSDVTEGISTPSSSRLEADGIVDEWDRLSRSASGYSSCSSSALGDLPLIQFERIEGSENGSGNSIALTHLKDLNRSSPPSVLDGNVDDTLYDHLDQAMAEAENAKREAFEEAIRRGKAEKDAIDAIRRAKASEFLYNEELKQRKEIEDTVAREREELEKMKRQRDEVMEELSAALEQKSQLESQIIESDRIVQSLEQKIISAVDLLQSYKRERDELHVERDNALREAEELRIQQGEASSAHVPQFFSDFSFSEIEEASQNFDPSAKIGEGGFGSIFKGFLRHTEVAIKMLNAHSLQGPSEFQQEVDILSKLRHTNLVTLIGACPEAWTLIYEYLPNGSLEDRLNCKGNTPPLSWQARIRIATELCSVLIFLHSSKPHSIVHGDLKPSNILLDANFVCKLSDFGISRLLARGQGSSNNTTLFCRTDPKGTFAYMDPEFLSSGELTPKSDVYSFGIILLRLLTGRPPLGITKEVQYALDSGKLETLLDPLAGDWPFVQAEQVARLALRCCEMSRKCRADLVSDVWRVLEPMRASCGSSSSFRLGTEEHFQPPSYFICPIFQEVMQDPHVAADGFTYEAEALRGWMDSGHETSPMTNLKLEHKNLVPNHALRSAIQEWLQQH